MLNIALGHKAYETLLSDHCGQHVVNKELTMEDSGKPTTRRTTKTLEKKCKRERQPTKPENLLKQCQKCNTIFMDKRSLIEHLNEKHEGEGVYRWVKFLLHFCKILLKFVKFIRECNHMISSESVTWFSWINTVSLSILRQNTKERVSTGASCKFTLNLWYFLLECNHIMSFGRVIFLINGVFIEQSISIKKTLRRWYVYVIKNCFKGLWFRRCFRWILKEFQMQITFESWIFEAISEKV